MTDFYCENLINPIRWKTRCVKVGNVGVGGDNPIRIQSMTTTDTMNTKTTIEQSIRMIDRGCEIVRITAPSIKEAKNLVNIKNGLLSKGYNTPLVADIHFTPNAAIVAADIVEKVRINPGNYADKKKFEYHEYTEKGYEEELFRIRERFLPLVKVCKENGTAMRIGTNHGSLSDRILSRYGDTPEGMVESAMEFVRIAKEESYHDIILSMKASNTHVMVQAYRLLVTKMKNEGMNYPLHLGVTEAGEAEDGRIKSSVGIGTLLEDGLGDTIRVSLTEPPEEEIPVARILVKRKANLHQSKLEVKAITTSTHDSFFYARRSTSTIANVGSEHVPRVIGDLSAHHGIKKEDLAEFGYLYAKVQDKWHISEQAIDFLYIGSNSLNFEIPGTLQIIQNHSNHSNKDGYYPIYSLDNVSKINNDKISFLLCNDIDEPFDIIRELKNCIIVLEGKENAGFHLQRKFFMNLVHYGLKNPVIIKKTYEAIKKDEILIYSSTDIGGLQIDGFGDGIWLTTYLEKGFTNELSFNILQACRTRSTKTEYISCPSCGRTLFDLQETTSKIRERTDHLKGIKIGIMGCIVNGPGEMADADYGYVGTGSGLISLYKGQNVVKKNIEEKLAVDALIQLIDQYGDWIEPNDV